MKCVRLIKKSLASRNRRNIIACAAMMLGLSFRAVISAMGNELPDQPAMTPLEIQNAAYSLEIAEEGMVLLDNRETADGIRSLPVGTKRIYNINNGTPASDDRDLCTAVLRDEWGFDGVVMTDWGGGSSTPGISMHAGNDLIMPGKNPVRTVQAVGSGDSMTGRQRQRYGDTVHISLGDVQKSAVNVLKLVMRMQVFRRELQQ